MDFTARKLIIYGTGINANVFIEKHKANCNIICCVDKYKLTGSCNGIPIKTWEDIEPGMADCLVIAASPKHVREIYYRVLYDCDRNNLEIYDWRGTDLRRAYGYEYVLPSLNEAFTSHYKERLLHQIDIHDPISFDLFDTLIMRRVMEPHDVYDHVDRLLPDDCRLKGRFKGIRRDCELETDSVVYGYKCIYERISETTGISKEEAEKISALEMQCEKDVLVCREGMKEIYDHAINSGKKVYIISDMYFGRDFISSVLESLGIVGYEDILVSCDYKKTKRSGLFEKYKALVQVDSYLHIGDNYEADVEAAERCGIDGFIIPSGLEMLRASNLRRILYCAKGDFNRRIIGELIASVFNDPFALCGTNGDVWVTSIGSIGNSVAPIVYLYLTKMMDEASNADYDKILLGARDGYIFNRIIKEILTSKVAEKYLYMYISRSLAFKLGMGDSNVDEDYRKYLDVDGRRKIEEDKDYIGGIEKTPYRKTKEAYEQYLNDHGVSYSGKYLFCDLISGGTVQHSLNALFDSGLVGFYLKRTFGYMDRVLNYTAIFEREEFMQDQLLVDRLETLICSPEPSVKDIDAQGEFLFEEETRSKEELLLLQKIQKEIIETVKILMSIDDIFAHSLDKNLAVTCFMMFDHMIMGGEVAQMKEWIYYDSNGEKVKLFR